MKLHFDSKQEFQTEAVKAITDIFEGQQLSGGDFEFSISHPGALLTENGFGNKLDFSQLDLLTESIQCVQKKNGLKALTKDEIINNGWNFSVEMETGTGKTYVYLRTIYELNKLYGFKKFVIVVPSVAIREGVMKNLEITEEHFQNLYDKVPVTYSVYDSRKVSNLRGFASANTIQVLVINIDSFAKDENIINKPNDKLTGKKPIEFIQCCRPFVIVDEPQNMETEIRKRAIENLSPLWDNPNVFQICTLNETKSEIKKRQEIGRGLRLSVNQDGQRIFDRNINKLTVVANERYEDFAKALQKEIQEDCGVDFSGRTKNKNDKKKVNYRKGFEADPKFLQIWEKIKFQTKYSVNYDTEKLVTIAANAVSKMDETKKPIIRSTKKKILITDKGVNGQLVSDSASDEYGIGSEIPDMLAYIQSKTELTRSTILEILKKSKRIKELFINPQLFMDNAVSKIKDELQQLMIDGIKYEKIGGKIYEMALFDDRDFEIYIDEFTHTVKDSSKTIYENYIPLDSGVENQFAKDCESSEQIEFYFKLPYWFEIKTPIGQYRPDWAVVFKGEKKIYFVAETKSVGQELKVSEKLKIECGDAHFRNFEDVVYKRVSSVTDLSN